MVATEYVLIDSNSIQLLYIGPATLTRTATTAPSRGTLAVIFGDGSFNRRKAIVSLNLSYGSIEN